MSARPPRHRLIRALVALLPLGNRRDDVVADLAELFDARRRERGRLFATRRLIGDVISLASPRRSRATRDATRARAGWISSTLADLRFGSRLLARHPIVVGATVTGLALAIAVCTTAFTILNASLLKPFGMDDPSSVYRVEMLFDNGTANAWPYHAFASLRDRSGRTRVAAWTRESVRVSMPAGDVADRDDPIQFVSGEYMALLGGRAVIGRPLQPADDLPGAPAVVVLHHRIWSTRLGADPGIVGRSIRVSGAPVAVVGVMDPAFTGPVDRPPALWAPFGSHGTILGGRQLAASSADAVRVIARVDGAPGAEAAAQDLSAIVAGLPEVGIRAETGALRAATGVRLDSAASRLSGPGGAEIAIVLTFISVVITLVVALASVNVANLLLAGAAARAREIGVRLAMGATRRRILRQLLTESVLLGTMAGVAGLLLSVGLVRVAAAALDAPDTLDLRPDASVLLFTSAIAILAGLAAGLAPARHGARGRLTDALTSQSAHASAPPKTTRLRRVFVGFQAAGSILLLVVAALFLRGAWHLTRVDLGFDADRLATIAVSLPRTGGDAAPDAFWRAAVERVRALPGVDRTALALYPPFSGLVSVRQIERAGRDYRVYENRTDAGYFQTAGFRLVRGRTYTADEVRADAPVAVVSENVARDLIDAADPIGASLAPLSNDLSHVTVIGIVADAMTARFDPGGNGVVYRPLSSSAAADARLVVRARDPRAIVRPLEQAIVAVDARARPVVTLLRRDVDRVFDEPQILAGLAASVAALALLLSVLGLFGVTSFVVGQRTWEMQVRRAIGASGADVVRLLVRQSLMPVAIGLACGLALALSAGRVLTPALSGISPYDPIAIGSAVAVLALTALAAVLAPALRAARAGYEALRL